MATEHPTHVFNTAAELGTSSVKNTACRPDAVCHDVLPRLPRRACQQQQQSALPGRLRRDRNHRPKEQLQHADQPLTLLQRAQRAQLPWQEQRALGEEPQQLQPAGGFRHRPAPCASTRQQHSRPDQRERRSAQTSCSGVCRNRGSGWARGTTSSGRTMVAKGREASTSACFSSRAGAGAEPQPATAGRAQASCSQMVRRYGDWAISRRTKTCQGAGRRQLRQGTRHGVVAGRRWGRAPPALAQGQCWRGVVARHFVQAPSKQAATLHKPGLCRGRERRRQASVLATIAPPPAPGRRCIDRRVRPAAAAPSTAQQWTRAAPAAGGANRSSQTFHLAAACWKTALSLHVRALLCCRRAAASWASRTPAAVLCFLQHLHHCLEVAGACRLSHTSPRRWPAPRGLSGSAATSASEPCWRPGQWLGA